RRTYICSVSRHLGRDVGHLDNYIDDLVIGRLSMPDARITLGGADVEAAAGVQRRRDGLCARLDELSALFADGSIDGPQLKRGTAELRDQLKKAEAELAAARASSALADFILAGDDLRAKWEASPPEIRGKII